MTPTKIKIDDNTFTAMMVCWSRMPPMAQDTNTDKMVASILSELRFRWHKVWLNGKATQRKKFSLTLHLHEAIAVVTLLQRMDTWADTYQQACIDPVRMGLHQHTLTSIGQLQELEMIDFTS